MTFNSTQVDFYMYAGNRYKYTLNVYIIVNDVMNISLF